MRNKSTVSKKATLPNDGERMVPQHHKGSAAYGDHIVRYSSVLPFTKGKVVLDIASGSGYGTQMIAKEAKKVYGVDIEKDAIEYARQNFNAKNVEFKVGSGTSIPLEDASVDVVVSFETIEHIEDSEKFIQEINRVLRPDGIAVISTPNDLEFPEGNHFHVHEYTYDELHKMLSKYFANIDSYYQGTWYYTALGTDKQTFKEWDDDIRVINAAPLKPKEVLFFMLVCSNKTIRIKAKPMGVVAERLSARSIQEKEILTRQHISNLEEELQAAKDYVAAREAHIQKLESEIHSIKSTKLYKTAAKIRHKIR